MLFLAAILIPVSAVGADLKSETIQRWEEYVRAADARNANRVSGGSAFLISDEIAGQSSKLRSGAIVVTPGSPHVPLKVPSGLIHDWIGAAFIPNATLAETGPVLRDYDRYKDFYHPNVIDSKRIATTEPQDQFSLVLVNRSVVAKTALDMTYQTEHTCVDDRRCYSIANATRIQEIADYDTPAQHILPENHGTGLIWRLHSISRFEERDGGVYIELEVIALSRDIPAALRWVVDPIVRRISRSSIATSLEQTEAAVRSHGPTTTAWVARQSKESKERVSATPGWNSSMARSLR
jgi:hypothetical protein